MSTNSRINWRRTVSLSATLTVHLALLAVLLGIYPAPAPRTEQSVAAIVARLIAEPRKLAGETAPRRREATPPPGTPAKEPPRAARVRSAATLPRPVTAPEPVPVVQTPARPPRAPLAPNELSAPAATVSGPAIAGSGTAGGAGLERGGSGVAGTSTGIRFASKAQPSMPRSMRGSKWSGYALIGLRIGADGKPKEVVVLRSSGVRDIDRTARLAAQRSTYVPHTTDEGPIEFWGVVPVVFGDATPDVERDLADLAERWRSSQRSMDAYGTTRPAV